MHLSGDYSTFSKQPDIFNIELDEKRGPEINLR